MPTTPVFVDTNILLYAVSGSAAEIGKRDVARQILPDEVVAFSVQVAQEFLVNATRRLTPPLSSSDAMAFLERVEPVQVLMLDYDLFRDAVALHQRFQISYWDAAIVSAARRLGLKVIYSEDLSHGQKYDGVEVLNPFVGVEAFKT